MSGAGRLFALAVCKVKATPQIVPAAALLILIFGWLWGFPQLDGLNAAALPAPEPPSNLIAVPDATGIYLQWDASPTPAREISEYRVERFREGDSSAVIIERLLVGRLSHFDSTGLGGIPYRYRVRARDWFLNDSPWSSPVVAAYKDAKVPNRPDSMLVTVNPQGLFIDWAPGSEEDLAGYRIYRTVDGAPWQLIAEPARSQYLDRSAEIAEPYLYAATALDYSGNESARSDTSRGFIPDGVPPASVPVFTTMGEPAGIRLQWQPPPDLDLSGFRIGRSTNPEFSDPLVQLGETATEFMDTTAVERRFYVYRITAVDRSGNTSEAVFADGVRPDASAPLAPTGLEAVRSEATLRLRWSPSPSPDLAYYRVYRESLIDTTRAVVRLDRSINEYQAFPFSPGLPRRYFVTAVDSAGNESTHLTSVETALVPGSFLRRPPELGSRFRLVARPGAAAGVWDFPGDRGVDWEALDPITLGAAPSASQAGRPVWARASLAFDVPLEESPQILAGGLGFVYTVPVTPGWNALASPFDIQLDWNLILDWNEASGPLLRHTGRWDEGHLLDPYEGAYWYNGSGKTSLELPYSVERGRRDSLALPTRVLIRAAPSGGMRQPGGPSQSVGPSQYVALGEGPELLMPPMPAGLSVLTLEGAGGESLLTKSVAQLPGASAHLEWRGDEDMIRVSVVEQPPGLAVRVTDQLGTPHLLTEGGTLLNVFNGTFLIEIVSPNEAPIPPENFGLVHVFPRPAGSSASIVYQISVPGPITLWVHDLLGRRVARLVDLWRTPGQYQVRWEPPSTLPNGTYWISLAGTEGRSTQALQLVR
ncbi:MAG: fibronectin type 3 domain-containing protein [Rhodothermales bacterium]|jgi:fibronectin type 3 domain-containing protein